MVTPYVNLERYVFSVGVSNALFSISRSYENILLIEQVVEIRYIALAFLSCLMDPNQVQLILKSHLNFLQIRAKILADKV